MDNYIPCQIQLLLDCPTIDQSLAQFILSSNVPVTLQQAQNYLNPPQKLVQKQPKKPKPKKQLRLAFRSPQIHKKFEQIKKRVPGRESEAQRIFDFISNAQNGNSSPLCLHGNTGCGKTSLITKITQFFEEHTQTVSVAYLNCMSARTVNTIYTIIYQRFYGGKPREVKASEALYQNLSDGRAKNEKTKIIVLDEIDHFIKEQHFLYNMLQWLSVGSKLILVLISNVIDLTVKLDSKLQSRWKFQTIIFQPYTYHQIEKIIYNNYENIRELCKRESVSYIAKRICNINSDIRSIDKIYNRIVQIHRQEYKKGEHRLLDIDSVKGLIYDDTQIPNMPGSYGTIIRIFQKADKKQQISGKIVQALYKEGSERPRTQHILYMLCDLQDAGFISITSNKKSSDLFYYQYGIKINQSMRLFVENEGLR